MFHHITCTIGKMLLHSTSIFLASIGRVIAVRVIVLREKNLRATIYYLMQLIVHSNIAKFVINQHRKGMKRVETDTSNIRFVFLMSVKFSYAVFAIQSRRSVATFALFLWPRTTWDHQLKLSFIRNFLRTNKCLHSCPCVCGIIHV